MTHLPASMNLNQKFKFLVPIASIDCPSFECPASDLVAVMTYLRDSAGYAMLADLTAVDNGPGSSPRFCGVYHVLNMETREYLRLRVDAEGDETPTLPSVTSIYSAANWHERETYDMFGITYKGHPDLRRILMWDGYPHFPLRKEFPLAGIEEEYPEEDVVERTGLVVKPAPMAGGPFVAASAGPMSAREPRGKDQSWTEQHAKD